MLSIYSCSVFRVLVVFVVANVNLKVAMSGNSDEARNTMLHP